MSGITDQGSHSKKVEGEQHEVLVPLWEIQNLVNVKESVDGNGSVTWQVGDSYP